MKLKFVDYSERIVIENSKTFASEDTELTEEQILEKAKELGYNQDEPVLVSMVLRTTVRADPNSKDQMTYYDPISFEKMYGPARIVAHYCYHFSQPQ